MTLERDIGRTMWVGFHGTTAPTELLDAVAAGRVGAVVLFARNIAMNGDQADVPALIDLLESIKAAAPADDPVLLAVDQEGGRVQRLRAPATRWPPMLRLESATPALAEQIGEAMGRELAAVGFDIDFAPVLDVHTNPQNPIIGDRAFATDPDRAAELALAFARGLARANILACGKHFPGHGDTATDSHLELPTVSADLERLREVELAPFARAARAGLPMLMTAHVVFPALDPDRPATLSARVVDDLLRRELAFEGVVVSDDIDMKAIANHYPAGRAAVEALRAGCDALLLCADVEAQRRAWEAVATEAQAHPDFAERVRSAAHRVRGLSNDRPANPGSADAAAGILGSAAAKELLADLPQAS